MRINSFNSAVNFKRALTTQEQKKLEKLQTQARNELDVKETGAIIFDFNMPSVLGQNYAIGSLNSQNCPEFIKFLKEISSISRIQAGPQGDLQYKNTGKNIRYNLSPYSGTTFTLGAHTIALEKLCKEDYGNLLTENYIKSLDENYPNLKNYREYHTDYDYALGEAQDGVIFEALHIAYQNFKTCKNEKLVQEFIDFRKNLSDYARKNLEFDSKNLTESIDFLEFCQFIAFKQHFETKENLNKEGIKYFGDC